MFSAFTTQDSLSRDTSAETLLFVCVYVGWCAHMGDIYSHAHPLMHTHGYTHTGMRVYMGAHTCTHVHANTHVRTCTHMHTHAGRHAHAHTYLGS